MPVTFMRGRIGEKGTGPQLGAFQPGLLTADGCPMEGYRLDHQINEGGDGHEPGNEVHLLKEEPEGIVSTCFCITAILSLTLSPNDFTAARQQIPIRLEMMTYSMMP